MSKPPGKRAVVKKNLAAARKAKGPAPAAVEWDLQLYVVGSSRKSELALCNLERLCEEHLAGRYRIQIIDLTKNPQLAHAEQITALPALVRKHSFPILKIIGTLFDTERVLARLDPGRPIAPGSKLFNDSNCVSTDIPMGGAGTIKRGDCGHSQDGSVSLGGNEIGLRS
jgi:circadian clock protein KaiB